MTREMKDSGVDWIGTIPKISEVIKLKYFSYMKGRIGWQGLGTNDFIDEGPYCITGTDFENGKINWSNCYHVSEERYNMDEKIQVNNGDLLITKDGTIGKLAIVNDLPDKACLNSHLLIIRPLKDKYLNSYLYYVMSSNIFKNYIEIASRGSIMDSLSQKMTGEFKFPLVDLNSQQQIVDYLDNKCSKIDEAVSRQKAIVEKLKEYRKSVITEAVTHGLNPNAEMKDSENELLGSFPSNWIIKRIKFIATVVRGGSPRPISDYLTDDINGLNWIKIGDATGNGKYINNTKQRIIPEGLVKTRYVEKNTLLLTNSMSFGHPYILGIDGCIHDGWLAFYNLKNCDKEYIYYYLESDIAAKQFKSSVDGSVVENLNIDKVRNALICLPSLSEQQQIVDHLDAKCSKIDEAISRSNAIIEKLEEYKKSIIYEYVTGKKEVPSEYRKV